VREHVDTEFFRPAASSVTHNKRNGIRALYIIAERYPTFRADVRVLFGKYLPRLDIHTDLVAHVASRADAVQGWPGGALHPNYAPAMRGIRHVALLFQDLRLLRRVTRAHHLVIVRDQVFAGAVGLLAARIARIPFVYWMSFPTPEAWLHFGRTRSGVGSIRRLVGLMRGHVSSWLLYGVVLRFADHVFVQSDRMKADVARKGIDSSRLTPVPMGVDVEAARALGRGSPAELQLQGRRVIAYLGTLDETRQPLLMIRALARIVRDFPDVLLLLVGDSSEPHDRVALENEVRSLGLDDHVLITGWLPVDAAWRLMRQAEVGLSPFPRSEILESASPTKVVEYLVIGLPVVVNDQPDQAKIVRESGGGFVVPLTGEGFAEGVVRLLADPEQAREMGASGQRYVEAHRSYESIARNVAEVVERVVQAGRHVVGGVPHE
jgi:glycosyltransferase involved in cell wall biosynthesis